MKNFLLFWAVLIIVLLLGLSVNQAFAFVVNGINVPDNVWNAVEPYSYYVITSNDRFYFSNTPMKIGGYYDYYVLSGGRSNNAFSYSQIRASNHDIVDNNGYVDYPRSWNVPLILKTGNKFLVTNNANTSMKDTVTLKLNDLASGIILVNDENNNFKNQYEFSNASGKNIDIKLEVGETSILYVLFMPDDIQDYFTLDTSVYNYLDIQEYTPSYKILGNSTVKLNGVNIPNIQPFLQSNYSTSVFYQYLENGITYTKIKSLPANQKVYFDSNKNYLIKFRHENTTTISVKSNFVLNDTSERISLLSDTDLEDIIINNGGVLVENTSDNYYEIDRFKYVKITGIREGTVTQPVQIDFQGDSNSNALIHIYDYNWDRLYKSNEISQQGNQGRYRITVPSNNGFIVIKESSGKSYVRIDSKYKENVDYTIQYLDSFDFDSLIEDEYHSVNPTPNPIQNVNDNGIKKITNNIWDSLFGGNAWTGINGDGQQDTSDYQLEIGTIQGMTQNILGVVNVVINPLVSLFNGIPELAQLMVFGFGLSVVLFVFGR